ncbi:uncharacterized protein HMPREF1541_01387 [Cyphellophora europaea CBS 101466]|uniref:Chitin-binding type-4 domain-containing protein n=1 Tax=Cyphellophora europaea (strain CBS 101466) TaxID=1220924 RepID=W2SEN5_CYPE1|nr:uncharacterized protein HMPREF1541_01387 [Cyphellophora europaea CBS 101466]ETN47196.1 hypothetical protein HMPREF1541_01387 [Cyphellophora europaea CBS 101466]
MAIIRATLISALASHILTCTAHMQMSWPYPLRSSLNPAVPESLKDYDTASPLLRDGTDFLCKGYQNNATNSQAYDITAIYQAGSSYNITLAGGATHSGGSCQISLSYDNGASFKVIESIIGGCPLSLTYDFTVPDFAPSSDTALLSWSWFNLIGESNMYQDCARVQVVGAQIPAVQNRRRALRYESRRQTAFDSLPDMFVCDVGNGCNTIERRSLVFPDAGASVSYGTDATTPEPGPGFTLANSTSAGITSRVTSTNIPPFPLFNTTFTHGPTGTGSATMAIPTNSTSAVFTNASSLAIPVPGTVTSTVAA